MQHGVNKPLTHGQVKLLGLGFTPTSIGITGQELKRAARKSGHPTTSRGVTAGRGLQYIPVASKDEDGKVLRTPEGRVIYTNQKIRVWHKTQPSVVKSGI